jgi:hypothetical protein
LTHRPHRPTRTALVLLLVALALPASASALTKPEFIAQADQICRPAQLAFKRDLRHAKKAFMRHRGHGRNGAWRARIAGRLYGTYGRRMHGVTSRLRGLALPPEDATGLGAWLDGRDNAADLYIAGARAVKHRKFERFIFTLIAATEIETEADRYVAGYGFTYCAPPARPPQL